MRAVGVTEYGGPEALHLVDVEPEPLGAGQVRIGVRAAAVSPTDTMWRDGSRSGGAALDHVVVPGMDAAGVLLEIGPDVDTDLVVGADVMAIVAPSGDEHGAYREDLVVPVGSVARTPAGSSYAEAATVPMNALTARLALDRLGLEPGQVLAVTGAAGAFGGYVVQLAKADGLEVVADAAEADEALVRDLGADVVVRRGAGFADAVRARFPDGVDALADGSLQAAEVIGVVKDGGAVATVRGWEGDGSRDLRFEPVMVRDMVEDGAALDRLREQVEAGALTMRVADVVPAADAAETHRRLEAGGVRGRLVIDFS